MRYKDVTTTRLLSGIIQWLLLVHIDSGWPKHDTNRPYLGSDILGFCCYGNNIPLYPWWSLCSLAASQYGVWPPKNSGFPNQSP